MGQFDVAKIVDLPTELLEDILSLLERRQLLQIGRVCKTFHNTTRGSLTLRRRIFQHPASDSLDQAGSIAVNPLLKRCRFWPRDLIGLR